MFWLPAGRNLITRRSPDRQPLFFKFVHFKLTNDKNQSNTGSYFPWKAQVLLLLAIDYGCPQHCFEYGKAGCICQNAMAMSEKMIYLTSLLTITQTVE